ncbi:MAG: DUF2188 domain-containing protein [Methanomassiliicoccaceae archaeon]|nr:DUF2188 domain-containing protein [Methanomassiliicoccaceae archaeon]
MSFFDKFKKKEESPKKEKGPEKDGGAEKKKDAAWATSRDKPEEEKEIKEEPEMAEVKKKTEKPVAAKKTDNKVWHITKRDEDGMWQVKAEGAARATKLFRTKAEAEDYVKTLVSNNEGSRVVKHKKTGEFQKK